MLKLIIKKLLKLSVLIFLVAAFLTLGNLYTYKRLTAEEPIAQLTFEPVNDQEFDATLRLGNSCEENIYKIYGDEWRIDSQFLKWKSWANLMGLDAMYRLDRLSGRYIDIHDENSKLHVAHELKTNSTIDLSKLAEKYDNRFPPVDTVYGSSAYEKMKPNVLYTVFLTQSGILIREQELAENDTDRSCTTRSKWKNAIVMLDQKLAGLINNLY